MNNFTE